MSTVAKKVIMGSGATAASAYEIEQSLILDSGNYLSFTPSSSGSRTTWTFSTWLKVKSGGDVIRLFGYQDPAGPHQQSMLSMTSGAQLQFHDDKGGTGTGLKLNRVLRDPSAWYHIVMVMDTTQGTAANRVRFYVNGELETSFAQANYPGQNASPYLNSGGVLNQINYPRTSGSNCQLAETHFVDGTALTSSSFGETNSATGQWIPKEYEGGSYGTNGFYLKFVSGAIGTDSSGEGNNYTVSNLSNSDVVIDTPTNNFATLNPLPGKTSAMVLSQGNLHGAFRAEGIANASQAISTLTMPTGSGKWYFEMRQPYQGSGFMIGISPTSELPLLGYGNNGGYAYYNANGNKYDLVANAAASYGTAWISSGQTYIISCYYDSDLGKIGFKLNGTDQGFAYTNVVSNDYQAVFINTSGGTGGNLATALNFGQNGTFAGAVTAQGNADANGIGDFYYAPPSGYKALCTANLPAPAIPLPSAHFNTVTYTGNGADDRNMTGVGFQPDFVWLKSRSGANNHYLYDAIRGPNKQLLSNATNSEGNIADRMQAFQSDGFQLGTSSEINNNGDNYVSWNWKANGAGSTDTSGDIDSVVSANQAAGFSIVTWTGDGSEGNTLAHGLGVVPELIIRKIKNAASSWATLTTVIDGSNDQLYLNLTDAKSNLPAGYGSLTSSFMMNMEYTSSHNVVAYCFASKPGFSKIGVYTGNGNADGVFISTGFKPAWVMIKRTDSTGSWNLKDTTRAVYNADGYTLLAEAADAEYGPSNTLIDELSNGFKCRSTSAGINANNGVYLYLAFADSPFKTATAR